MKIDKIIEVLSGYGSEKELDLALSKIGDLLERKKIKDNIAAEIEKAQSVFENASRNEEFDFQGLIELVKGFDDKDFINKYTIVFSEPDKLEKAKEKILNICIRDTHATTPDAKSNVKRILENCFSIVEEILKSELSKEDLIEIGLINNSIDENTKKIIENSNQNTQKIINEIQLSSNKINATKEAQLKKTTLKNDNTSYITTFSEVLFLEDEEDENAIKLKDIYISPSIKGKDIKASECINKWYKTRKKPCLLLYGNAGVGKSSFISKILADANRITEKENVEFAIDSSKVTTVALRNHTDKINDKLTAEELLTTLFSCDSIEQLQDKLIILDGLDELCVLKQEFDGQLFLHKLSQLEYGFHVLVTSRESESYFREPNDQEGLKTERLIWGEKQLNDWLKLYKYKKPNKVDWCKKFYEQFCSLEANDNRREIFCIPIIMYIGATTEIDLENHNSVGSIYRDSFIKILCRKHIQGQRSTYELKKADKEANLIAWQYTKELAYQMFLLNTLDLIDDNRLDKYLAIGFHNAKKRTRIILKEKYNLDNVNLELKKELAVCPFAKENEMGGISFAHKTVYEYFTAVKLYEDYFAGFDSEYFSKRTNDIAAKEVMGSFIEAFRYKSISKDIFSFLCIMNGKPFSGDFDSNIDNSFEYKLWEESLTYSMNNQLYCKIDIKPAIEEYLYPSSRSYQKDNTTDNWVYTSLLSQFSHAFSNLTWFITLHGFNNREGIKDYLSIGRFVHSPFDNICCKKWNMKGAYLVDTQLSNSDLSNADLTEATLSDAKLTSSNLIEANFTCAIMVRTDFINAVLTNATFKHSRLIDAVFFMAQLDGADLSYANLTDADLTKAVLTNATLKKARLIDANLFKAQLNGADLSYANLSDSVLTESNLTNAIFTNADLSYSDLSHANLTGANFTNASLQGTVFSSAKYCNSIPNRTIFPENFDPQKHDMIEVEIVGKPVKDE